MNDFQRYEAHLKSLPVEELIAELTRQRQRERAWATSNAAHDAAIFFGMTSYTSTDGWRVAACERELARRG